MDGYCRICGDYGKLSFEHVPPRSAFNRFPVVAAKLDKIIGLGPDDTVEGRISQKGRGDYTLCPKCNNNTGRWYARDFTEWCYQAMDILQQAHGKPSLIYVHYLFPLRIIKQVVTMFFSLNHSGFRKTYPDLEAFVLNRKRRHLDPRVRIYVYYNVEGHLRSSGLVYRGSFNPLNREGKSPLLYSETNFPPFGFVMTYDSEPPDPRLVDITHFADYDYDQFKVMSVSLPVLPTHLWIPGDYRTKDEIREHYRRNLRRQGVQGMQSGAPESSC